MTETQPAKTTRKPPARKEDRTIYERLAAVMDGVTAIGKSQKNIDSGYSARSIDDVLDLMHGVLAKEGVFVLPNVESVEYVDRETVSRSGKDQIVTDCRITVRYEFVAPDGTSVSMTVASEGRDYADKATNKASSNAFKYGLLHAFLIPVKDSVDSDATSIEVTPKITRRTTREPVKEPVKEHPDLRARNAVLAYTHGEKLAAKAVWGRLCTQLGFDPDAILESESDADAMIALIADIRAAADPAEPSETLDVASETP